VLDGILVVIPTRNRVDFAERAVRSMLAAPVPVPLSIVVSDNSTDAVQAARLEAFCTDLATRAVDIQYVRPDSDLSMSEHWEWARIRAFSITTASHCIYLTDRSVFKPDALATLADIARRYPDDVVTYDADEINDVTSPVLLRQVPTTGALLAVPSARLQFLTSQLLIVKPLPRMLNTMAPRAVLDRAAKGFGSVFDSVAPDFTACFRILLTTHRVLFCDRPLLTMYGTARSNGATTANGVITQDSAEFLSRVEQDGALVAGDVLPGVATNYAIIAREYLQVMGQRSAGLMPALNRAALLRSVTLETEAFAAGRLRDVNVSHLEKEGVRFGPRQRVLHQLGQAAHYRRVLGTFDFLVQLVGRLTAGRPLSLADTDTALSYAVDHPRATSRTLAPAHYLRGRVVR
jgi:hypothetical protein